MTATEKGGTLKKIATVLAIAGFVFGVAACGATSNATKADTAPGLDPGAQARAQALASSAAAAAPSVAPSATASSASPDPTSISALTIGKTATFTKRSTGNEAGSITVVDVSVTQRPTCSYCRGPENGYFVIFTVKVTAKQLYPINRLDFYVRGADGSHFEIGDGNGYEAVDTGELNSATLQADESTVGKIGFDVSSPHGTLEYAPNSGEAPLSGWTF